MSTKERREREKRIRRETILRAADKIIRKYGIAGASMDKIAEEAELSKGALYLYFPNKETFLVELQKERQEKLIKAFDEIIHKEGEFEQLLGEIIDTTMSYFSENISFFRLAFHGLPGKLAEILTELKEVASNFNRTMTEFGTRFFKRFYDKRKFWLSPRDMYLVLRGLMWSYLSEKTINADINIETKTIIRIFLKGVER